MMSPDTIRSMTQDRTALACKTREVPYLIWPEDIDDWRAGKRLPIPFPNLGDHIPDGYELDGDAWMIDTSGFGSPGEPALTLDQLFDKLEVGKAYAFVETGQFQSYLQQYIKQD